MIYLYYLATNCKTYGRLQHILYLMFALLQIYSVFSKTFPPRRMGIMKRSSKTREYCNILQMNRIIAQFINEGEIVQTDVGLPGLC